MLLPLVGAIPVAIALHPSYLVAVVPAPHAPFVEQIESLQEKEYSFTYFSAGLKASQRVVIPGSLWGQESEHILRAAIHEARAVGAGAMKRALYINRRLLGAGIPTPRQWEEAQRAASKAIAMCARFHTGAEA